MLREKFDRLGQALGGLDEPRAWYHVPLAHIRRHISAPDYLEIEKEHGSVQEAICKAYPEAGLEVWLFHRVPTGFWHSQANIRPVMDWASAQLGLKSSEEWYSVRSKDLIRLGLSRATKERGWGSLSSLAMRAYPEHTWEAWRFREAKRHRWASDPKAVAQFFDWLKQTLNFSHMDDWYSVTYRQVLAAGGGPILQSFGSSLYKALRFAYPAHEFSAGLFKKAPAGFWAGTSPKARLTAARNLIHQLQRKLNIDSSGLSGWYRVSASQLGEKHRRTLAHLGGLPRALALVFPDHAWQTQLFSGKDRSAKPAKATQRSWMKHIGEYFNSSSVSEDVKLQFRHSLHVLEVDLLVKEASVAVEYEGEGHFFDTARFGDAQAQESRDSIKALALALEGIRLIEIPYWQPPDEARLALTMKAAPGPPE